MVLSFANLALIRSLQKACAIVVINDFAAAAAAAAAAGLLFAAAAAGLLFPPEQATPYEIRRYIVHVRSNEISPAPRCSLLHV
jgi:hypothetical protein